MIEATFRKTIEQFPDIVEFIEQLELSEEEHVSRIKAKLKLFDGSALWIREVWIKGKVEVYSYYWLRPDETIIMGWDNAPHHREIATFPHHKHAGNKIEPSQQMNIHDVLSFIREFLG
ncbi:MAG: hypothetical protein DDT31_01821 [Syntrophomonadaceae bacterium]|nr:hypothetical protein [Bacillota bacterium]